MNSFYSISKDISESTTSTINKFKMIDKLKLINKRLQKYPVTTKWSDRDEDGSYTKSYKKQLRLLLVGIAGGKSEVGHLLNDLFTTTHLAHMLPPIKLSSLLFSSIF